MRCCSQRAELAFTTPLCTHGTIMSSVSRWLLRRPWVSPVAHRYHGQMHVTRRNTRLATRWCSTHTVAATHVPPRPQQQRWLRVTAAVGAAAVAAVAVGIRVGGPGYLKQHASDAVAYHLTQPQQANGAVSGADALQSHPESRLLQRLLKRRWTNMVGNVDGDKAVMLTGPPGSGIPELVQSYVLCSWS